jgi:Diguanylate cyclase, GGDEF domain
VLAEAARRIAAEARAIDSIGRIGGEEFAWLLPDASAAETLAAAERLRAAMHARPFAHGLPLTASIGICDLAAAPDPSLLLERADQALYWAKSSGRDAALQWTPEVAARAARTRSLAGAPDDRVAALARLADEADPTADRGHGRRVADLSVALAAAIGAALAASALDAEQSAGSATTTSAGTARATPTARPARRSPTARGSSRWPTRGTR